MLHYVNEVSEEQLNHILDKITEAVKKAIIAGVDVIEVHGDRLVGYLCSTIINKRTGKYGCSFENRTRFALAVVEVLKRPQLQLQLTISYQLLLNRKTALYLVKVVYF